MNEVQLKASVGRLWQHDSERKKQVLSRVPFIQRSKQARFTLLFIDRCENYKTKQDKDKHRIAVSCAWGDSPQWARWTDKILFLYFQGLWGVVRCSFNYSSSISVYVCLCVFMYMCIHMCICACVCMFVYLCVSMCVCNFSLMSTIGLPYPWVLICGFNQPWTGNTQKKITSEHVQTFFLLLFPKQYSIATN
jgi:hypothetical protein